MKLNVLANEIKAINESLQQSAAKAINKHVTARNWLIGYCIVNYEQHGEDRAAYGERTLQALAEMAKTDCHIRILSHTGNSILLFPSCLPAFPGFLFPKTELDNRWLANFNYL